MPHYLTINSGERVAIIGSGGKTTLMTRLAQSCSGRVIMSTTTHLALPSTLSPSGHSYPGVFVPFRDVASFSEFWRQGHRLVLTARYDEEHQRLIGLTPAEIDALSQLPGLERLLVEADGSKRLPIKAHKDTEPVLFSSCTLGVAVLGLKAFNRQVAEGQVHRPELLRQLLHCDEEHRLTTEDLATATLAYLEKFSCSRCAIVLSQAEHCAPDITAELIALLRERLQRAGKDWEIITQSLI